MEAMLMIEPRPLASIPGRNAWIMWKHAVTLTENPFVQSSSLQSRTVPEGTMPAQLNSTSTSGKSLASFRTASISVTSSRRVSTEASVRSASSLTVSMSVAMTRAPSDAMRRVLALPMPAAAAVTRMVLPFNLSFTGASLWETACIRAWQPVRDKPSLSKTTRPAAGTGLCYDTHGALMRRCRLADGPGVRSRTMTVESSIDAGRDWLRDFFPGYFALVMGTGIIAVAAHLLSYPAIGWALFTIAVASYAILWIILLARLARHTRSVIADFATHDRGPAFLTIVAATGVLGSQFDAFGVLTRLLPLLFWFSLAVWSVLVYGFLSTVTVGITKPDLEHGLNGAWLLLVVATESVSVLGSLLALHGAARDALVFVSLAFYLLGSMLYVLLSALIFFRWVFRPMYPAEMGASWWIN